ncbi:alpha-amylase family protein [Jiangella rhizosphaerae]|uniref:Glycosidase n=1 Tax=Jiangella rhizosphaerae TaxID=2293569 RepID=A0A418KLA5_9ACTN|nr:alpha-amylase family protein [Jiangella rhizosphaerae]RIQ18308.1 glycosidase [Jiangella rhizosphaerae]
MSAGRAEPWYARAVLYQVDPLTFADADGDGTGDLPGVTSRLGHIADLGATAVWLQPFYRSPFRDGGYDVTDHCAVDPSLGTLDDVDRLVAEAERHGLRVVVDLVGQHTSVDHPWFQQARRDRGSPYRDYFIWSEEPADTYVEPIFPTVEDGVWAWDEAAGQFYRHTFYSHEPDLNLAKPDVREEVWRIVEFWLERGVSGFRVDALPHMTRTVGDGDDAPGLAWIEELRQRAAGRRADVMLLGEVDVPPEEYAGYFGSGARVDLLFDFWVNNHLFLALARQSAEPISRAWAAQPRPPQGAGYAVWLRNHDELDLERLDEDQREEVLRAFAPEESMRAYGRGIVRRLAPMLAPHGGDAQYLAAHSALLSLPGIPVLRYGDEIGMGDDLTQPGRAAVRTAMQWDAGPNGGFSAAPPRDVSIPVVGAGPFDFRARNVRHQRGDETSVLTRVRNLVLARRELGALPAQRATVTTAADGAVLVVRHDRPDGAVLQVTNLSGRPADVAPDGDGSPAGADLVADRRYDGTRLAPFGYRWYRVDGER